MRNLKASSILCLVVSALITLSLVDARAAWTRKVIDGGWVFGNSITIDSKGKVHISSVKGGQLFYINNAKGHWKKKVIDASGRVGLYTGIALDKNDGIHISYHKTFPERLQYATNSSGTWATEAVDTPGNVIAYNAIAIDPAGKVHISYYERNP